MNYNFMLEKSLSGSDKSRLSLIFSLKKEIYKIAYGEIIEIDGIKYHEVDGDLVMYSPVSVAPKALTVNMKGKDYVFQEGGTYQDAAGHYVVNKIDGDKMDVTYLDGQFSRQQRVYDAKSRALIIDNAARRQDAKDKMKTLNLTNANQYFTLGFLCRYGRIWVEIPQRLVPEFEDMYKRFTGNDPKQYLKSNNKVGGYAILREDANFARPMQMRIAWPQIGATIMSKMDFGKNISIINDGNRLETSNADYLKNLFKLGFTIGENNKNYQNIKSSIPQDKMVDFESGYNFEITEEIQ